MNHISKDMALALDYHTKGSLAEAESLYRDILAEDPNQIRALHNLGVIGLQTSRPDDARILFETALVLDPGYADAHANLGVALKELGLPGEAEGSLRKALELNPDMGEAHFNLGNILGDVGRMEEAVPAYGRAIKLTPDDARPHAHLGAALLQMGAAGEALAPLEEALCLDPHQLAPRCDLAVALRELGRADEALAMLQDALSRHPDSIQPLTLLADLFEVLGRFQEAKILVARALDLDPRHAAAHLTAAKCARRGGRLEEALELLDEDVLDFPTSKIRAVLLSERAAIQDRLGNFSEAYQLSLRANQINAAAFAGLDPEAYRLEIERATDCLTKEWAESWTPPGPKTEAPPAFLLGFPRSGTTLLEQILKAHPDVESIEERPLLAGVEAAPYFQGKNLLQSLPGLDPEQLEELHRIYLTAMESHTGPRLAGRVYLDKMPLNTLKLPLIHRLFPRAKIIFVLRHPCDCCISGVMQSYQPNGAMAGFQNLESAARFYGASMDSWRRACDFLALDYHLVRYEYLISDFKTQAGAVLDHLGLGWDEAVSNYREQASASLIATPSYHQVRESIYCRAMGRWLNYREYLEPVLPILAPHAEAFGYEI